MGGLTDFLTLKSWVEQDWKAQADYREAMEADFAFADGHHWTDTEKSDMENQGRQPVVFDFTSTLLASVAGNEINNRTEVRFIPREIGDIKPNEILTAGAQWFRDDADAEDGESQAFLEMLRAGIGWTETYLDYDEDEQGAPAVQRVDPLEMGWDAHCTSKGLKGASRVFRVRRIPLREAEDMFPGKSAEDIHCDWIAKAKADGSVTRNLVGDEYRDGEAGEAEPTDLVTVVQVQWRERRKSIEYIEPSTGQKAEMPKADWDKLAKAGAPVDMLNARSLNRWEWFQAFLGADSVLKKGQPCKSGPTFQAMTGHWDRKDRRFYGLLAVLRDPQKYLNKWLSQTLHIINSNAKGGVMMETDAVEDVRGFEDSWAAADAISWVRPGAMGAGKVQPKPGAQMPQSLMQLTEFALMALPRVSGVSLELQGLKDAQQAGVLEYQRRQAAMVTLAHYFDALRYYRKMQGQVILYFLVHWIAPTGRLVRIQRDGLQQYVPLALEQDTLKYDVIVDDAPSAPNEKERAWAVLEKMLPFLAEMLPPELWPDVLEHSPLPGALVDKMREFAERKAQEPPQPLPEEEKIKSETIENQSQAQLNMAKAQQTQVETMIAPQKAMYEAETKRMIGMETAKNARFGNETARFSAQKSAEHGDRAAQTSEFTARNKAMSDRMRATQPPSAGPR